MNNTSRIYSGVTLSQAILFDSAVNPAQFESLKMTNFEKFQNKTNQNKILFPNDLQSITFEL